MTTKVKTVAGDTEQRNKLTMTTSGSPTVAQGSGMKLMSGASPRMKLVRLSEGEGDARRNAGLMECIESLLLLLLNARQGAATDWRPRCCEQPADGEGSAEGAGVPETSRPRGVVFGVPGGHRPWKSEEWTILSSTSFVL